VYATHSLPLSFSLSVSLSLYPTFSWPVYATHSLPLSFSLSLSLSLPLSLYLFLSFSLSLSLSLTGEEGVRILFTGQRESEGEIKRGREIEPWKS
jgi:hypothetical protein